MANNIALFKNYVPMLDEVYKVASLTSVLDGAAELARQGVNANELVIPMMQMDGLADYSRNGGYVNGDVTLTHETKKCNFDRGRMFSVDSLDNAETAGIAYGRLASEFIRTKVVPELDAFRLAAYASVEGIGTASGSLTSAANVVTALREACNKMDEDEVPAEERYLFITPTLISMIEDLDTTKSRAVLDKFSKVIRVPQSRFYTAIEQIEGGYNKASNAKNINFMVIHKPAVIQFQKHVAPKVITPEQNQNADAWKFGYRNVGIAEAYENKVAGIYMHASTT
jgi:hypothetical protein